MKTIVLLSGAVLLLTSCTKTKDEKAEESKIRQQAGTYHAVHYKVTGYDYDTGLPKDSTLRDDAGTVTMTIDSEYTSLNYMQMQWAGFTPRVLYKLQGYLDMLPGNGLGCYWIPDMADKRILIYGLSGGGSEYVQVNLETIDSKHQRWTYIETASGFDGQATGGTMRVKEIFEMEKD